MHDDAAAAATNHDDVLVQMLQDKMLSRRLTGIVSTRVDVVGKTSNKLRWLQNDVRGLEIKHAQAGRQLHLLPLVLQGCS